MKLGFAIASFIVASVIALAAAAGDGAGGVLGVLSVTALAGVCVAIVAAIERRAKLDLTRIFLYALAARILVATLIDVVLYGPSFLNMPGLFAPDELQYLYEARLYVEYLQGHGPNPFELSNVRLPGVVQLAASCFYLFGPTALVPKLVITVLGAWIAVFSAIIAEEIQPGVGRRAGYLVAFFPSLVLWTSMVLKDGPALWGITLVLTCFVLLRSGRRRGSVLLIAGFPLGLFAIATSRPYEMAFAVFAILASFLFGGSGRFGRNFLLFIAVSLVLAVVMQRYWVQPVDFTGDESPLAKVAAIRSGFAEGTGSAIAHDIVDVRSPSGLLLWIPIGLAYFFLAPVPFTGQSIISYAVTPEMLIWYALLPAAWRGLKRGLRERRSLVLPLVLYATVSAIGWSILVTNVGTMFRFRAQILFVPMILIAYDQVSRRRKPVPSTEPVVDVRRRAVSS